jgi:hypothetical protein
MAQSRYLALQNNPNIARFMVEGIATGRQLGIGSYGSVEEVCCDHNIIIPIVLYSSMVIRNACMIIIIRNACMIIIIILL